ncbi:MAG: hypothetical protein H6858_07830 [Rhodospirillales bacterium]|nr:hypothetical protein [Alphaproteobacteria bacterium]MCB9977490.1 hypothetical protein [Rhodospirillales bacterium]
MQENAALQDERQGERGMAGEGLKKWKVARPEKLDAGCFLSDLTGYEQASARQPSGYGYIGRGPGLQVFVEFLGCFV